MKIISIAIWATILTVLSCKEDHLERERRLVAEELNKISPETFRNNSAKKYLLETTQIGFPKDDEFFCKLVRVTPNLRDVFLDRSSIGMKGIECLRNHPGINRIDLIETNVDGEIFEVLATLPRLGFVNLMDCKNIGDDDIEKIKLLKQMWDEPRKVKTPEGDGYYLNHIDLRLDGTAFTIPGLKKLRREAPNIFVSHDRLGTGPDSVAEEWDKPGKAYGPPP